MCNIDEQIKIIDALVKVYDDVCRRELKIQQALIENELKDFLKKYDEQFNLVFKNSVHKIKYYKIEYRVKKAYSLYEKFIRKNIGFELIEKFNIKTTDDIYANLSEIKNWFMRFDDVIGIRVMTELKEDCKSIYNLFKNYKNNLEGFIFLDLENQPATMENGLAIYKIKGIFNDKFGFELQIKSKIDSAWGDIDHGIFYKNYSYSPIKNTVQISMNHIGNLLEEVESLLFSLREASNNYEANAIRVFFRIKLNDCYGEIVSDKIKCPYKFDKIIDILFYLYEKTFSKPYSTQDDFGSCINLDFLDFDKTNDVDIINNYYKIRSKDIHLFVLELIYIQWVRQQEGNLTTEKYKETIRRFFEVDVISYIKVNTNADLTTDIINIIFPIIINYLSTVETLFDVTKFEELIRYNNSLIDIGEQFNVSDNTILILSVIFLLKRLRGDYQKCILGMKDEIIIEEVKLAYSKMFELVKSMLIGNNHNYELLKEFPKVNSDILPIIVQIVGEDC